MLSGSWAHRPRVPGLAQHHGISGNADSKALGVRPGARVSACPRGCCRLSPPACVRGSPPPTPSCLLLHEQHSEPRDATHGRTRCVQSCAPSTTNGSGCFDHSFSFLVKGVTSLTEGTRVEEAPLCPPTRSRSPHPGESSLGLWAPSTSSWGRSGWGTGRCLLCTQTRDGRALMLQLVGLRAPSAW